MKIQFCISSVKAGKRNNGNPIYRAMTSIREACESLGHEVIWDDSLERKADIGFMFGSVTKRKSETDRAKMKRAMGNAKLFHLDTGLFSVYVRNAMGQSETDMFRLGLGDCVGTGNFLNEGSDNMRYKTFKKAFNFSEHDPRHNNDGPILFLLQSERGWQYNELVPFHEWARLEVMKLRRETDRKIILRAHPNPDRQPPTVIAKGIDDVEIEYADRARMTLLDSIRNAHSVVTHSSSAALEAVVEGIPTYTLDDRGMTAKCTERNIKKIEDPYEHWSKRQQQLYDWAYTSWHTSELAKPEVIEYYLDKVK